MKISVVPALVLVGAALFSACTRNKGACQSTSASASGLVTGRSYVCNTVTYERPMQMFTQAGEVTDPAVIKEYQAVHPELQDQAAAVSRHPRSIDADCSPIVYFDGQIPYRTLVSGDVIVMRQADTSTYGHGNPEDDVDTVYRNEVQFLAMRDAMLEMRESKSRIERLNASDFQVRECYHIEGSYKDYVIRLPYTFVASRVVNRSYPFALKRGAVPVVPAGDTLLVREGYVDFR